MSDTIRINEYFLSTQGEGQNTGHVSLFVRLFSCNLKCPGFSLPKGVPNTEIPMIIKNIDQYSCSKDLPLTKTGCDSYPASWSEFKRFSPEYTADQMYNAFIKLTGEDPSGIDLVFTGGEPLLKPSQKKLVAFMEKYYDYVNKFASITFETNGTQVITEEMKAWLSLRCKIPVIFSVSPKLECSGEPEKRRVVPDAIESIKQTIEQIREDNKVVHKKALNTVRDAIVYLKYVVKDEDDVKEALDNASQLGFEKDVDGDVYLMPVGGTFEEYMRNQQPVADLAIKYNCVFCIREHVCVYRNTWMK